MTVKELKAILLNVPDDLTIEVWDGDYANYYPLVRVTVDDKVRIE